MNRTPLSNDSVLGQLRSLMPARVLTCREALQRAELQADRLLRLHHIANAPVPSEIVTEAPRIVVDYDWNSPVNGSAHWNGSDWVITLSGADSHLRQRFSLLHEYKHIVDHPTRHFIRGGHGMSADLMAERVADYFAASVLMPKAWVKTAFFTGTQRVEDLALHFDVSRQAMSVRLRQLGLSEPSRRCRSALVSAPLPATNQAAAIKGGRR